MIDVYFWPTGNGKKITTMLEERGLPYDVIPVNINKGDQVTPEYDPINPNNKLPAIIDRDAPGGPLTVFESGAILQYLAEKSGKLQPTDVHGRYRMLQWVSWQVGGLGPMAGQAHHFLRYAQAARPASLPRRRLFDGRHRRLAVGGPLRLAGPGPERLPECEALVRDRRRPARGADLKPQ